MAEAAPIAVTATLDQRGFAQSLDMLAKGLKKSRDEVLPYHTASCIKRAMIITKSWDSAAYEKNIRLLSLREKKLTRKDDLGNAATQINIGQRGTYGRVFLRLRPTGGKPRFIKTHDPVFAKNLTSNKSGKEFRIKPDYLAHVDSDVADYKQIEANKSKQQKGRMFLAKHSWIGPLNDMRFLFGIDWLNDVPPLSVPGLKKILGGTDRRGIQHKNGGIKIIRNDTEKLNIYVMNWLPSAAKWQIQQKMDSAIASRKSAIMRETRAKVFADLEQIARRYPFMKTL
jgi:hypothetical protein